VSTTIGIGSGIDLELTHEIRYPHSLGLLYSAFTAYLGFEVNEGEYKVMGMAAFGRPRYVDRVRQLIALAQDGSFHLDMGRLEFHRGARAFGPAFEDLFGPPRHPDAELEQVYADIAAKRTPLSIPHPAPPSASRARCAVAICGWRSLTLDRGFRLWRESRSSTSMSACRRRARAPDLDSLSPALPSRRRGGACGSKIVR
jgi:hypothetical protein